MTEHIQSYIRFVVISLLGALIGIHTMGASAWASASVESGAKGFSARIIGDWVGANTQNTNGQPSPIQYFHLKVRQTGADSFSSIIRYFRYDEKKKQMVECGNTDIVTTISKDGTAVSRITGRGQVFVEGSLKREKHSITETVKVVDENRLEGNGKGTMSIDGVYMNMVKGGKITKSTTTWVLSGGVLTIKQHLRARFALLFFSKSFKVESVFTAHRGKDLTTLIRK